MTPEQLARVLRAGRDFTEHQSRTDLMLTAMIKECDRIAEETDVPHPAGPIEQKHRYQVEERGGLHGGQGNRDAASTTSEDKFSGPDVADWNSPEDSADDPPQWPLPSLWPPLIGSPLPDDAPHPPLTPDPYRGLRTGDDDWDGRYIARGKGDGGEDLVDAVIHEVWCIGGHDEADPCPPEKVPRTPEMKDKGGPHLEGEDRAKLRRITRAVAAGGDVIVTGDKPDPDAPVHGLQETLWEKPDPAAPASKPPTPGGGWRAGAPVVNAPEGASFYASVQHTPNGKYHRAVVWFHGDEAQAKAFAAWVNTTNYPEAAWATGSTDTEPPTLPDVEAYNPDRHNSLTIPRYHAFDPGMDERFAASEHFCRICGHSRYNDQHVLKK